jgi:hypothetical protein
LLDLAQRLADRCLADTELSCDTRFDNSVARLKLAGKDSGDDRLSNVLTKPATLWEREGSRSSIGHTCIKGVFADLQSITLHLSSMID